MFAVWLFLFFRPSLLENNNLRYLSLGVIKFFERYFNRSSITKKHYLTLFNCYFRINFSKQLGRYQLSKLTNQFWFSYFVGAVLMSVVMLATHQVDFIWQTSILSSDNFQVLTQYLAYFPQQLGFPVPSTEQIQQSYLGTGELLDAENRRLAWSSLLISSLLLYGLLPRLFFYLLISVQFKRQKSRYRLNLSASYYVQLRQLLKPNKAIIGVTDADTENKKEEAAVVKNAQKEGVLPSHFYPIAIELSGKQLSLASEHLLQCQPLSNQPLFNVCDYESQQRLRTELQKNESDDVVLYAALSRLPDRGLKRFIGELTAFPNKCFHLVLIVENKHNKQRDSSWYQLADETGIKLDNILHIEAKEVNHE